MNWLKSRTIWTVLALVAMNTIPEVKDYIPSSLQPIADMALGLLAVYFRANPKVQPK